MFGVKKERIRPLCVLLPLAPKRVLKGLGVERLSRGKLYGTGESDDLTVIHTGMGAVWVGDAVLELADSPARRLILFGTCGTLGSPDEIPVGTLVAPGRAFAAESFTRLLLDREEESLPFSPDPALRRLLLSLAPAIREVTLLSVGSIKLEEEKRPAWIKKGIEAVDLESAAFFAAARARGLAAVALLLVSDVVGEKPFYRQFSSGDQSRLNRALYHGVEIICRLNEKLTD